jgi:hypothetical protein
LDNIKLYTSQLAQIFSEQLSADLWIFRGSKNAYSRIHSLYFCGFVRVCNFKIKHVFTNAKKYVEMLKNYRNCSPKAKNMMENSWKEILCMEWWNNFLFTLLIFYLRLVHKDRYVFGVFHTLGMVNNEEVRNSVGCAKQAKVLSEGDYFPHLIIYILPLWLKREQFLQFI